MDRVFVDGQKELAAGRFICQPCEKKDAKIKLLTRKCAAYKKLAMLYEGENVGQKPTLGELNAARAEVERVEKGGS